MKEKQQDYTLLNGLALAYMGDAVFEIFIREYLLTQGSTKPNKLHQKATQYVSAKAQADFIYQMVEENLLTEEELEIFKRGRNAKSHTTAKNADVKTYRASTGFEALMGYLHLTKQETRLIELMNWCIVQKEKINEKAN